MSDIQLVLTDFDGTVVQLRKHEVSDKVREAVIACEDQGVRVVPITGRYYEMARPVLDLLGFDGLGVFDNGASIYNCQTGEIVWTQWLDSATIKKIASVMAPVSQIIDYVPEHNEHQPADNELEIISQIEMDAPYVFGLVRVEQIEATTTLLDKIPGATYYVAPHPHEHESGVMGVQVNHKNADKFHGAEALREMVGVSKEHTLAIGDGGNDLPLFQNAGLKIAMGNAVDELKAVADYVVSSVDDDGFAEAMNQFVLHK